MTKEKVRVYALARDLDMESKDLLDMCRREGIELKNQLSSLDPEQQEMIEQMVKRGTSGAKNAGKTAKTTQPAVNTNFTKKVRSLAPRARSSEPEIAKSAPAASTTVEEIPREMQESVAAELVEEEITAPDEAEGVETKDSRNEAAAETQTPAEPNELDSDTAATTPTKQASSPTPPMPAPNYSTKVPTVKEKKIPNLTSRGEKEKPRPRPQPTLRASAYNIASPPTPKSMPAKDKSKTKEKTQQKLASIPIDQLRDAAKGLVRPEQLMNRAVQDEAAIPSTSEDDDKSDDRRDRKKKERPVGDRQKRKEAREKRAEERKRLGTVKLDHGKITEVEEEERGSRSKYRRREKKRAQQAALRPARSGPVSLEPPITVRSLCEALGIKYKSIFMKLMDLGLGRTININTTLEPEIAEELALEEGCEIAIKRPPNKEDELLAQLDSLDDADNLKPRAPIVTVMGHVDHGKTSLLDKIRQSNVVDTEAGGITQVIRAWRVEHDGKYITFLDTPGHHAFTKMRARGAQVTDIAVIVVAADDGVMPQTEEAINHAKAAGVSLVVAINKIDVPNANINKTLQQLYSLDVLPDNMGGDTPFVHTSAATGEGIDELLESISLVAELKELKANPDKPAKGICLEAMISEDQGVQATILVREGTLNRGDVMICGAAYGRIRQMYNDQGRSIQTAGPSVPVRITGLDQVPNADDPFVVTPDLNIAREIVLKRRLENQQAALEPRTSLDLFQLAQQEISELKLIIKADFRGSVEAIRKELEKLQHDEVRVKILHTGMGGISESDVQLALTSPNDTMIVGFNVVPDDRAKALAEEKQIPIREYNVIYMLTDDIRNALEGKLKPRQDIVHLGRAVVRETFKISRVGTIAGCYVTQGIIKRNAKVRLIREGAIIYPPPDKTAGLDSLKRFKDDAAEVREGFECGIKIAGYDDLKVDDVIEAYRIEEVQRTLDS